MPRAIVMLRGQDWLKIRTELSNLVRKRNNPITDETGALVEFYLEMFGWPDFIVCLWGTNVEMIQKAVEGIRQRCQAHTTTMMGILPEERLLKEIELKEKLPQFQQQSDITFQTYRPIQSDQVFEEYIALHKAFLSEMEKEIGKEIEPKKFAKKI